MFLSYEEKRSLIMELSEYLTANGLENDRHGDITGLEPMVSLELKGGTLVYVISSSVRRNEFVVAEGNGDRDVWLKESPADVLDQLNYLIELSE